MMPNEPNGIVDLLPLEHALPTLRADLEQRSVLLVYAYLIDPVWFDELFGPHLEHSLILLLADGRQRSMLRQLCTRHPRLRAATWSTNRTMHDKTLIFPQLDLSYLTTANVTRGSWTLAMNNVARIQSAAFTRALDQQFQEYWNHAHQVPKFKNG